LKASRKLRMIARNYRIEIMNPQGMYTAMSTWLATLGKGPTSFKVITTIHMISSLKLYRFAWLLNIFSEIIITESRCEKDRLIKGGTKKDKIFVVPNSVDMDRFSSENAVPVLRNEYQIPDGHYCFGIVARLSPEKRHQDFIEAARIVHQKHPKTVFFIVGNGSEREIIRKNINRAEKYIIMTGARRDIPDVLKSLDCFVLCSDWESLPLSIREAMSMGLPVIVTNVGGVKEAVIHEITGFIVPQHLPEKLAEAMNRIIENDGIGTMLGRKGLEYCRQKFELKKWSKTTEALFEKTIA